MRPGRLIICICLSLPTNNGTVNLVLLQKHVVDEKYSNIIQTLLSDFSANVSTAKRTYYHDKWSFSTAWYGTARYGMAQFAFPLQFSTAIEWAGLFTRRYNCAASTAVTSSRTRHKQTHNKERRRNSVLHSRHVDVFNNNGEVYENAWDLPPAAETVVTVTRAVDESRGPFQKGG